MSGIGGGIGSIIGGLIGGQQAEGYYDDAAKYAKEGLNTYKGLTLPDIEKMKLFLEELQSQGSLTPFLETAVQQADSRLADVSTDPRLKNVQLAALEQMTGISQTGMTDIDKAALQDMLRSANAEETAARASILQNRAARGMAGSGDELAASLAASQGMANRRSDEAMKLAANAMQNRLNAVGASSEMARMLDATDYGRQAEMAKQRDAIAQFNAQLSAGSGARNTAAQNQAQAANLANQQALHNANVSTRNEQQQYNKQLAQQDYENKLKRAQGITGSAGMAATSAMGQGDAAARKWQQIGQGVGAVAGAFATGGASVPFEGGEEGGVRRGNQIAK